MSSYEDGPAKFPELGIVPGHKEYLSPQARQWFKHLMRFPEDYPIEMREWVINLVEAEARIPRGQVEGLEKTQRLIEQVSTTLDVVNTTSEVSMASFVIEPGTMGKNGQLKLTMIGDARGTSAGSHVVTFRLKFGGSIITTWTRDYVNNTVRGPLFVEAHVINQNNTSAQIVSVITNETGPDTGVTATMQAIVPATAAINTSEEQTLALTAQWATGNSTNSVRRHRAQVVLEGT